jgi:hypothetical protein
MPAVVKRTDGSFSGTSEADGMIACPRASKKARNVSLISRDDSDALLIAEDYML